VVGAVLRQVLRPGFFAALQLIVVEYS
jgi:hypothetical protein